jgi:hypothetical protein
MRVCLELVGKDKSTNKGIKPIFFGLKTKLILAGIDAV